MNCARIGYNDHDVYLIKDDGVAVVYAPTLGVLLRVLPSLHETLLAQPNWEQAGSKGVKDVSEVLARASVDPPALPPANRKSDYFHLALGLTHDCTLRCAYCHAEAGEKVDMDKEILAGAIAHAFSIVKRDELKGLRVSFAVGGEPTARWTLFTDCVNSLRSAAARSGAETLLSMTTNGYYGTGKRDFVARNLDAVLVSIDGPAEVHDRHRPTRQGRGSHAVVVGSVNHFLNAGIDVSVRATVSSLNVSLMPDIVRDFACEFGKAVDVVFEPLIPIGRGAHLPSDVEPPCLMEFANGFTNAVLVGQELGVRVTTSAANSRRLVRAFCGAMTAPAFTVSAEGKVTTCERDSSAASYGYGRWDAGSRSFLFDDEAISRNLKLLDLPDKCADCFGKWHCAGDCPDARTLGYDRCELNKTLIFRGIVERLGV